MNPIESEIRMAYSSQRAQNVESSQKTEETQQVGGKAAQGVAPRTAAPRMDVVEISTEGRQAAAVSVGETQEEDSGTALAELLTAAEEEEDASASVLDSLLQEDDSSVSTSELYSATESELKTFVSDGTITRAEMEQELARRSGTSAQLQSVEE